MAIFNFNDLSKSAKVGYNALYNVIRPYSCGGEYTFIVPLCLDADNKVSLTEKNFIFFESVLDELSLFGWYSIVENRGRAFDNVKGVFFTVSITVSDKKIEPMEGLNIKTFDFSKVDTTKLMKRNGKAEKAKTAANKIAKDEVKAELEEAKTEVEALKKEVAKKEEQLNKKAIDDFNDDALLSIADCIEALIKKHCKMVPSNFDFSSFEADLFKAIENKWAIEE